MAPAKSQCKRIKSSTTRCDTKQQIERYRPFMRYASKYLSGAIAVYAAKHKNRESRDDDQLGKAAMTEPGDGWGGRIRTYAWRYQKPLPYRLATPQNRPYGSQHQQHTRRRNAYLTGIIDGFNSLMEFFLPMRSEHSPGLRPARRISSISSHAAARVIQLSQNIVAVGIKDHGTAKTIIPADMASL